jgi:hypothetical protein
MVCACCAEKRSFFPQFRRNLFRFHQFIAPLKALHWGQKLQRLATSGAPLKKTKQPQNGISVDLGSVPRKSQVLQKRNFQ